MSVGQPRAQGGFSLIEALIALVIIMIGLLGVAGLQALGIHSSAQAHVRTLAALDAHSLAASMRANHAFWSGALAPPSITITAPATVGAAATVSPSPGATPDCIIETCTPLDTAVYDLQHWGSQLAAMQHHAKATITRIATAGTSASAYKVTVTWTERRIKGQGVSALAPGTTQSTTVVVQP